MIGLLIGSIIGFKFGGMLGAFMLGYVGFSAEEWVAENILGRPNKKTQIQQAYFEALFSSIGKLAKVDGVVTASEIKKCEIVMRRMNLSQQQRRQAIKLFNNGKQDNFNLNTIIADFARKSGRSYSVKQMFLEMLIEVASAEGRINHAEWQMLLGICKQLSFPQQLFVALVRMRGFNVHGQYSSSGQSNQSRQQYQQWKPPKQHKTNSYEVLGVNANDSKQVIRRAYKKLMSSHHPDKLIAKGLPPEMVEIAKKKTQNIQAAWEDVKEQRGF